MRDDAMMVEYVFAVKQLFVVDWAKILMICGKRSSLRDSYKN